jgi:DNA-binding Lrp family transcriptional regulator
MAKVKLSPDLIKGIEILNSVDENQLRRIIQFLKDMPIGTPAKAAEKSFNTALGMEDADVVFPTIVSIITFVQTNKDEDALKDILESVESKEPLNLDKLKSILSEILDNSRNITLTTKAVEILNANNDNYIACKAITDIRLIFNDNITEPKRNAVIVHKLHFTVSNPSNSEDVFIHLDMRDLIKLKDVIERAILKEELIKEDYESINFISPNQ